MNAQSLNSLGAIILDACITVHKELGPGLLESAYEIALEQGFVGTEAEWLASLKASIPTSVWTSQEW